LAHGAVGARDSGRAFETRGLSQRREIRQREETEMKKTALRLMVGVGLASLAQGAFAQNFNDPKEFQAAKDLLAMTP
jgi:hypothetical protein